MGIREGTLESNSEIQLYRELNKVQFQSISSLVRTRHLAALSSLLMRFGKTSMRLGQPLVVLELLHAVRRFHFYTHINPCTFAHTLCVCIHVTRRMSMGLVCTNVRLCK